jgi:hypothetical protein
MNKKKTVFNPWNTKKNWSKVLKQGLQVLFHIAWKTTPGIPQIVVGDFNVDLLSRKDDVITRTFSAFEQNIKSFITRKLTCLDHTSFSKGYYTTRVFSNNSVHLKWVIPEYIYKMNLLKLLHIYSNICHIMVAVINWHFTSLLSIVFFLFIEA